MDNLKKYLQHHLADLDNDMPDEAVWQRIQQSSIPVLPQKNVVKMVWGYAAAACVLAAIVTTVFLLNEKHPATELVTTNTGKPSDILVLTQPADIEKAPLAIIAAPPAPASAPITNRYTGTRQQKQQSQVEKRTITVDPGQLLVQDVERNYTQLVNYQLERLRTTPVYAESPNYFSTFKQQLKQIETDEATIKKDIRLHGLTDELLQQLININQQKLTVLKDLQAEINKLNTKVKSPGNRADSSQAFYLTM